jgi:hypothetical protein
LRFGNAGESGLDGNQRGDGDGQQNEQYGNGRQLSPLEMLHLLKERF